MIESSKQFKVYYNVPDDAINNTSGNVLYAVKTYNEQQKVKITISDNSGLISDREEQVPSSFFTCSQEIFNKYDMNTYPSYGKPRLAPYIAEGSSTLGTSADDVCDCSIWLNGNQFQRPIRFGYEGITKYLPISSLYQGVMNKGTLRVTDDVNATEYDKYYKVSTNSLDFKPLSNHVIGTITNVVRYNSALHNYSTKEYTLPDDCWFIASTEDPDIIVVADNSSFVPTDRYVGVSYAKYGTPESEIEFGYTTVVHDSWLSDYLSNNNDNSVHHTTTYPDESNNISMSREYYYIIRYNTKDSNGNATGSASYYLHIRKHYDHCDIHKTHIDKIAYYSAISKNLYLRLYDISSNTFLNSINNKPYYFTPPINGNIKTLYSSGSNYVTNVNNDYTMKYIDLSLIGSWCGSGKLSPSSSTQYTLKDAVPAYQYSRSYTGYGDTPFNEDQLLSVEQAYADAEEQWANNPPAQVGHSEFISTAPIYVNSASFNTTIPSKSFSILETDFSGYKYVTVVKDNTILAVTCKDNGLQVHLFRASEDYIVPNYITNTVINDINISSVVEVESSSTSSKFIAVGKLPDTDITKRIVTSSTDFSYFFINVDYVDYTVTNMETFVSPIPNVSEFDHTLDVYIPKEYSNSGNDEFRYIVDGKISSDGYIREQLKYNGEVVATDSSDYPVMKYVEELSNTTYNSFDEYFGIIPNITIDYEVYDYSRNEVCVDVFVVDKGGDNYSFKWETPIITPNKTIGDTSWCVQYILPKTSSTLYVKLTVGTTYNNTEYTYTKYMEI